MTRISSAVQRYMALAVAAPLLAACAGGGYPLPGPTIHAPPPAAWMPSRPSFAAPPRFAPPVVSPYRPSNLPPFAGREEPVRLAPSPPRETSDELVGRTPSSPSVPESATALLSTPTPRTSAARKPPAPAEIVDSRPPGTRCGWWQLCNLWE
jgi:hypothetical protein